MEEPLTEDLLEELRSAPTASEYLNDHATSTRTLSGYLCQLLDEHGLRRRDVIRESNLDATYGYQLFSGERKKPSRDKALCLAFGLGCSLRETDRLLQAAGVSRLYVKERRDAIIAFCINNHASLSKTNETLYSMGEDTLG